jgi:hypothetical protein
VIYTNIYYTSGGRMVLYLLFRYSRRRHNIFYTNITVLLVAAWYCTSCSGTPGGGITCFTTTYTVLLVAVW